MRILHIADIHFRSPDCNTEMDPDRPFRTVMVRDLRALTDRIGKVDIVLVGGDISYQAEPDEYDFASHWLTELVGAAKCGLEDVFVVPGNHDVRLKTIRDRTDVQNVQEAIWRAANKESELKRQFRDERTCTALFAPLEAYNKFAARFNCQLLASKRMFWTQERTLSPSYRLRLFGLTSIFLSGRRSPRNEWDQEGELYLSPLQTVLDPSDGTVNLVLVHHPPDWLSDSDQVDDELTNKALIHLFGHKHKQRCTRERDYIRFSAGAISPDRHESGFEPGYNVFDITVDEANRQLQIEAHIRVWQTNPDQFRAKLDGDLQTFRHSIPIKVNPVPPNPPPSSGGAQLRSQVATELQATAEISMSDRMTRELLLHLWDLAASDRRTIFLTLGLISDEDSALPEAELYGRALLKAQELGLMSKVAEAVQKMERR